MRACTGSEPATHVGAAVVQRFGAEVGVDGARDHFPDQLHRSVGDGAVVQGALARRVRSHGKAAGRPDRAGVHFLDRLNGGDPPRRFAVHDGPVQGGGAPVALRSGMDDDRRTGAPHRFRDALAEKRAEHQVGVGGVHRRLHCLIARSDMHGNPVPGRRQIGPDALAQPVERRTQQQNP